MSKTITLKLDKKPVVFNVTNEEHEKLINELQPDNKVAPLNNFLVRCVTEETKDTLRPFLENPAVVVRIGEAVAAEFIPEVAITVGE